MKKTAKKLKELDKCVRSLVGQRCTDFKDIAGSYDFGDFVLTIDYVPDDPARFPVRLSVGVPLERAKFPKNVFNTKSREIAARDFLTRTFGSCAIRYSLSVSGIRGGRIYIDRHGQEILETSAVVVGNSFIEARFMVDLPVVRGKTLGTETLELFMNRIPKVVRMSLFFSTVDKDRLTSWLETVEDADNLRDMLKDRALAAFIADGSILSKRVSKKYQKFNEDKYVSFISPEELAMEIELPNRGKIRGMGIPAGVTLITGGMSHGKSTLIRALELGVYNHIPGDGRELVVTVPDAAGIRTEEGRRIEQVNISPFFPRILPAGDPEHYSTSFASAPVSQAAAIMEALDIGTSLLLIDEDTSAASLMVRDSRMQALVPKSDDPVIPLVDVLPALRDRLNVSSIVIAAGFGDYIDCADTVIVVKDFKLSVITEKAKRIANNLSTDRISESSLRLPRLGIRCPLAQSLEPMKAQQPESQMLRGRGSVQYGDELIDLSRVNQLVSQSQARGISRGIAMVHRLMSGSNSLREAINKVITRIEQVGLDSLSNRCMGDLAGFRAYELAAAVNRLKNLKITHN